MSRQHGIDRTVRLVAHIAPQAEARLDATGVHMGIDAGTHRAEVAERQHRNAVHAMRTQINDAPRRPVLVEDRFGLDAIRVVTGILPVAAISDFRHLACILP